MAVRRCGHEICREGRRVGRIPLGRCIYYLADVKAISEYRSGQSFRKSALPPRGDV